MADFYLGIDGGQSHTEAVVADARGNILGRGRGGPSNHAEQPGGRERLRRAIVDSVGSAMRAAGKGSIGNTEFASAHCAMTGGADFKEEVIGDILPANHLTVGHDAPAALAGATGGEPGIVIIAGTGSVAYGEKSTGESLRIGGWGYLFGDEGGGFWLALEGIRAAMRSDDGLTPATGLTTLALEYFGSADLRTLAMTVYRDEITRDRLAKFAALVQEAASGGDVAAQEIVRRGGEFLAYLVATLTGRLRLAPSETRIATVGGVFRGAPVRDVFERWLNKHLPEAQIVRPRFDPAIGALLLAYREAGIIEGGADRSELLTNLEKGVTAKS